MLQTYSSTGLETIVHPNEIGESGTNIEITLIIATKILRITGGRIKIVASILLIKSQISIIDGTSHIGELYSSGKEMNGVAAKCSYCTGRNSNLGKSQFGITGTIIIN
ncbi:MAG: hypothetical protein BWY67_01652 [Bacteroidetes bacterium ADurb.Bin397]|nr:MAG: hypothetical protein BWY67_01652 [Bacteroidetes bacterium ADurb.Bin397]